MKGARGIITIHPRSYKDSTAIGEAFRAGYAVLLNTSEMEAEPARQLIDFVSGMIFGLDGNIDRVAASVLLLVPHGVTVMDDSDNLTGSFFNQF